MKPANIRERVSNEASLHWRYLHQDGMKTWKEIACMKDYKKYSKAIICRHMRRKIDDSVIDRRSIIKAEPKTIQNGTNAIYCDRLRYYAGITGILQPSDLKFFPAYPLMFLTKRFDESSEQMGPNTLIHVKRGCLAEEI